MIHICTCIIHAYIHVHGTVYRHAHAYPDHNIILYYVLICSNKFLCTYACTCVNMYFVLKHMSLYFVFMYFDSFLLSSIVRSGLISL